MRVTALPLVVGLFAQWTTSLHLRNPKSHKHPSHFESSLHIYPSLEDRDKKENKEFTLFLEKDIQGFKEALAFKESQGRYTVINTFGYIGINGVLVTESGILAAAHLAGPGAVKKFLRSNGKTAFADGYGTTIEEYMQKFKSFNVSDIIGNRKAKA